MRTLFLFVAAVLGYLEGLPLLPDKGSIGTLAGIAKKILSGPRMDAQAIGISDDRQAELNAALQALRF